MKNSRSADRQHTDQLGWLKDAGRERALQKDMETDRETTTRLVIRMATSVVAVHEMMAPVTGENGATWKAASLPLITAQSLHLES